jgi:hypothetical protein
MTAGEFAVAVGKQKFFLTAERAGLRNWHSLAGQGFFFRFCLFS